jgi:hypothetical protein
MFVQLVIREIEQKSKDLKNLYLNVEILLVEAHQTSILVSQNEV